MRHTIRFQPSTPPPRDNRLRRYGLLACMGGVLVIGGLGGLALNHNPAGSRIPITAASLDLPTDSDAPLSEESIEKPIAHLAPAAATNFRVVEVSPPEDPFLPTHADPSVTVATAKSAARSVTPLPAATQFIPATVAGQATAPKGADAAPKADEISVTGIVQGDVPVAVVRYAGQSFFLKIGDQVADTWRLVEIKERSALFQLGARRVEVPIKGGSSE